MYKVVYRKVLDGIVVDRIVRDKDYTMPSVHFHPEFEIYCLIDGMRHFYIDGECYTIDRNNLVLVDTMQVHKTGVCGKGAHDRFLIELTSEPFCSFWNAMTGIPFEDQFRELSGVWRLSDDERERLDGILEAISTECCTEEPHFQTLVMMKIAELLFLLIRHKAAGKISASPDKTFRYPQINMIADYIRENYSKPVSLDLICSKFFISKSYLCRVFKHSTGYTIREFAHMCRIKKAQELLKDNKMSVLEISSLIGYKTPTHFERVFRKFMETTPLRYRKKMLLIEKKVRERKDEDI